MGCDVYTKPDRVPYCKPKCKEFRLVAGHGLDQIVSAECKRCRLHHEVTLKDGLLVIEERPAL